MSTTGPLNGLRVLELAGIGPGPHAAMILADLGADVVRIPRPSGELRVAGEGAIDPALRGRRNVAADLKQESGRQTVLRLAERADVLIEGFRPGVAERLGVGPDVCLALNPQLVYARMTGWGQDGPLAHTAGHDLNYIAVTGMLGAIGRPGSPPPVPLNIGGDFGGGSMLLVIGVLAAAWEAQRTGQGQVVDAAIVDGASLLVQMIWGFLQNGTWIDQRGANLVDGAAPFYDCYTCSDGGFVAVAAVESKFYAQLLAGLGLTDADLPDQMDRSGWPTTKARFAEVFGTRTRDEWAAVFEGTDACVSPVLSFAEVPEYPHIAARQTLITKDGLRQVAPAPRFSASPATVPAIDDTLYDADGILAEWTPASAPTRS